MAQEWEETKARQDQQLENIETGLGHLKEIGGAMNEELQRHDILLNEVDEKMDKVTKELQTNNMRLKGLVTKVGGCGAAGGEGKARRTPVACWTALHVARRRCPWCCSSSCGWNCGSHPASSPLQTRSTRNFIVDVVLICVVLAIGLYLFNFLR
jgi:hypothetical protein